MGSFEAALSANVISSGKNDPPETDLDYYSKPENYTGSTLQSLQRFKFAKDKEEKELNKTKTKKKRKKFGFDLFARYKHILKGIADDESDDDDEEDEDDEEEGDAKEGKNGCYESEKDADTGDKNKTKMKLLQISKEDIQEKTEDGDVERAESSLSSTKQLDSPADDNLFSRSVQDIPMDSLSDNSSSSALYKRKGPIAHFSNQERRSPSTLMKVKLDKDIKAKLARERFRKAYRIVILVNKMYSLVASKDPSAMDTGLKTFTDIASEASSNMKNSGLSFDPSFFKAKKEINISSEVKMILSLPTDQRTQEQVQTAMYGLQSLRSFAEYPLHMQEKLAKVAWYEKVPPKRIIIRQGHFAENFYFILSGQAVVTLLLRNPKTGASFVKTATIMRKGMSFGELALLHRSRRTATVTSQGTVQLLTIGREDFFDIFMSGDGDQIPEHIKFISQCEFMKEWPIDRLLEHPEQCLLHFFKRNVVIVKDSNQSEWLYVVKSGTCQVLKELRGVKPKIGWKMKGDDGLQLPVLGTFTPRSKIDTGLRKRRVKSVEPADTRDQENKRPKENLPSSARARNKTFSKDAYTKFPTTQKAHFSAIRDHIETRKKYEVPSHCKPPKRHDPSKETDGKPPPVFVSVESLKPRDTFGLETIRFDDDVDFKNTSVSLVSRGAECIMLSKEFFVKHANETVKRLIRYSACPYPDQKTFQDNLQTKADWELYKEQLLTDLTSVI